CPAGRRPPRSGRRAASAGSLQSARGTRNHRAAGLGRGGTSEDAFRPGPGGGTREDGALEKAPSRKGGRRQTRRCFTICLADGSRGASASTAEEDDQERPQGNVEPIGSRVFRISTEDVVGMDQAARARWRSLLIVDRATTLRKSQVRALNIDQKVSNT